MRQRIDKCNKAARAQRNKAKLLAVTSEKEQREKNKSELFPDTTVEEVIVVSAYNNKKIDLISPKKQDPKTTNPNQPKQKLKDLKKKHKTDDERNQQSEALSDSDTENRSPLKSRKDDNKKKKRSNFTMIVKPDCMSQGKGIFMTHDLYSIPLIEPCVV